ncbi:MAG: sortase [Anaerolineaceae bacterium]|nr:sortase [Anaerolineaceae bacterium]
MLERIRSSKIGSIILLLAGVAILFYGATQVVDVFEKVDLPVNTGEEIPRDMIEAGYSAEAPDFTPGEDNVGFVPLFAPQESASAPDITSFEQASGQDMDPSKAQAQTPTVPVNLLQGLRDKYQEEEEQGGANPEDEEMKPAAEPRYIYIPSIVLEAPIIPAVSAKALIGDVEDAVEFDQWLAPDEFAVGWHSDSAPLGEVGNTVLNGHHNAFDRVFRNLAYLQEGDVIQVYGGGEWYNYVVVNKMVLPEWGVSLEKRLDNARWIMPSDDERLTLVTCWPEQSNSHRLIIVAVPF